MSGIYGIFVDDSLIYIGQSVDIKKRFIQHKNKLDKSQGCLYTIIEICKNYGSQVTLKVLEIIEDKEERLKREKYLIQLFQPLANTVYTNNKKLHLELGLK